MGNKRNLLMSIDIGTQSTRVALFTATGEVVATAGQQQEMHTPHPGWAEQDPDLWWQNTVSGIKTVLQQAAVDPDEILCIGVGGQMHGTVPLSDTGELLSHNVQLWCDKRSADLVEIYKKRPVAQAAYQLTASPPVANWIGFKIQWLQQNMPQLYQATWKFVVPKDYINYRLTGAVVIDYSEASGSFLMDAETRQWSKEILDQLDLDGDKLPDIHRSTDVIGTVTPQTARLTGLQAGTPVVAGGGDMLCMLLAAGLTKPGAASDITGTSSIFSVFTTKPVYDPRLMNLHHVTDGWIPFGITDAGGVSLKWFRDQFCQHEIVQAQTQGIEAYDLLNQKAAQTTAGGEGLLFLPYLMGERTLGTPHARAVFFGLTPRHDIGSLVRAIMEGVTFELKRTLEIVEGAGHRVDEIYHSGGGAYSQIWSQIKANIYQKPVLTFKNTEGGLLGAAILAGVGAGVYSSEAEGMHQCLKFDTTFTPDTRLEERYHRQYEFFKEIHDVLQQPFEKLPGLMSLYQEAP